MNTKNTKQYSKYIKNHPQFFKLGKFHLNTNDSLQYEPPTESSHLSLSQYSKNLGPLIYIFLTPSSNGTYEIIRKFGRTKNWAGTGGRIYTYENPNDKTTSNIINELIKLQHYTIQIYGIKSPPYPILTTSPITGITTTEYYDTTLTNEQRFNNEYKNLHPNNEKTLTFQTQKNL